MTDASRPNPEPHIPADWAEALTDLVSAGCRRVVVLGATDRGKSTFCRLLRQRLRAAGRPAALVDADIGQKDAGPPATVTRVRGGPQASEPGRPDGFYFVGAVDVRGHLLPVVVGTRRLAEAAGEPVVINTPGMIHGAGRILQTYQLESLRPDAVVVLERAGEAGPILAGQRGFRLHRLRPSPAATGKTPAQRRAAREAAFAAYFRAAVPRLWSLKGIGLQRTVLFSGDRLPPGPHRHLEETAEGRLAVGGPEPQGRQAAHLAEGFERDLLCGVVDGEGTCLGLARLEGIDFRGGQVRARTPVPPGEVAALQLGDLYVAADGRELDRARPRGL